MAALLAFIALVLLFAGFSLVVRVVAVTLRFLFVAFCCLLLLAAFLALSAGS